MGLSAFEIGDFFLQVSTKNTIVIDVVEIHGYPQVQLFQLTIPLLRFITTRRYMPGFHNLYITCAVCLVD